MLLLTLLPLLHALSQEPAAPRLPPPPRTQVRPPDYRIGRTGSGYLLYQGRLTPAGADELRGLMVPNDTFVATGNGGDMSAALEIVGMINSTNSLVRVSSGCFRECAVIAVLADRSVVTYGATLLFTRSALEATGNLKARSLAACIPSSVPDAGYVWFAPEVLAGTGLGVRFEWTVEVDARPGFEELVAGRSVAWVDACEAGQ